LTRRLLFGMIAAPLLAQSKAEKGKAIVDAAIKALGGTNFLEMKDRTETGRAYSFYDSKLSGLARAKIMTRYVTAPDPPPAGKVFQRERQLFGKKLDYGVLFDEDNGWSVTFRGAAPVPPAHWTRYQESTRNNVFYLLRQRLREPGLIVEFKGTELFDNQPTEAVDFVDANNATLTVQFHYSTHLPVRQVYFRRDPMTKDRIEEVTVFSKYRDVGGVQWPFAITRHRDGNKTYEMFAESVTINEDLPDQHFTIPANVKILKPPR